MPQLVKSLSRCYRAAVAAIVVTAWATGLYAGDININSFDNTLGFKVLTSTSNAVTANNSITTLDYNGDGLADVVISNYRSMERTVSVLMGQTDPPFTFNVATLASDNTRGFQITYPASRQWVGHTVASAGDFNGDGFEDFLIGDWDKAFLVYGRASGWENFDITDLETSSSRGFMVTGGGGGGVVQGIGDLNGDGYDDIAISTGGGISSPHSRILVLFGRSQNPGPVNGSTFTSSDAEGFVITRSGDSPPAGFSIAGKLDFNGDGFDDLAFATQSQSTGEARSKAYVYYGKPGGYQAGDLATFPTTSTEGVALVSPLPAGYINSAGDFNGDGFDDLLVGESLYLEIGSPMIRGRLFIVPGRATSTTTVTLESDSWIYKGSDDYTIGLRPGPAGDLNADGYDDVAVYALSKYRSDPERVFIFYGRANPAAVTSITDMDSQPDLGFTITATSETSKPSIAGGGDFNGDGVDDLFVNWFEGVYTPTTFILKGKPGGTASVTGWELY